MSFFQRAISIVKSTVVTKIPNVIIAAATISASQLQRRRAMATMSRKIPTAFHLAFPVHDLNAARHFYGTILGCEEGRSSARWIDYNLHGCDLYMNISHHVQKPSCSAFGISTV